MPWTHRFCGGLRQPIERSGMFFRRAGTMAQFCFVHFDTKVCEGQAPARVASEPIRLHPGSFPAPGGEPAAAVNGYESCAQAASAAPLSDSSFRLFLRNDRTSPWAPAPAQRGSSPARTSAATETAPREIYLERPRWAVGANACRCSWSGLPGGQRCTETHDFRAMTDRSRVPQQDDGSRLVRQVSHG